YGTFFYTQKGSIISTVVLPTTEIIEPIFLNKLKGSYKASFCFQRFLMLLIFPFSLLNNSDFLYD
ncbi:hypothetical protein QE521_09895, partial [Streptococcus suis]